MDIRKITNQDILNQFVSSQKHAQFLQSWEWGEFQYKVGNPAYRFGLWEGDALIGAAQILERTLPLGNSYWYCPRGPVIQAKDLKQKKERTRRFVEGLLDHAREKQAMFLKIEPLYSREEEDAWMETVKGHAVQHVSFVQPQDSRLLDISASPDQLLKAMHSKTRYNIRLAKRHDVSVERGSHVNDFDVFWTLMQETIQRDSFRAHGRSYYRELLRLYSGSDFLRLYIARADKDPLAAHLVVHYGDTATYIHGASSNRKRHLMAPHLLQWKQIREAQKDGKQFYDFWGIAPPFGNDKIQSAWAGITRFKKGFGGFDISFVGAYDLIIDRGWYTMYSIAQKVRTIM